MIKITVIPSNVYIEKGRCCQYLNFDFLLENTTSEELEINTIQVLIFDSGHKLLSRRFINRNGSPASIYTLPNIKIAPKDTLYIFNPFYFFDADLKFKSLYYTFYFDSPTNIWKYKSEVIINPVYYETKTDLILPLNDRLIVYDGHEFYSHHRRIDLTHPMARQIGVKANSGRYAYDFCVVNKNGDLYKGEGNSNEDWFGFGVKVYAPGKGRIVEVVDNIQDNILGERMFDFDEVSRNPKSMAGNYVIIDHKNGEYSLIGHFMQGSIDVKEGDEIEQGQYIAQMGFSGATADWVHIHYELRDGIELFGSEGLPSYFGNFNRILGSNMIKVEKGQIDTGDIVESLFKTVDGA